MADNKYPAGGTFGDSDWNSGMLGMDNKADFATDSAGIPSPSVNNKFNISTSFGDKDSSPGPDTGAQTINDFAQDSSGIPSVTTEQKTDMNMGLTQNMFPRQKGHDSLTDEEAQLS